MLAGVTIDTEFQILITLLAEKAAQLALTENQLFRIFCRWEKVDYDAANVVVTYPQRFELYPRFMPNWSSAFPGWMRDLKL